MNTVTKRGQLSAIYARVSSERQKEEGTIESQLAEVEKAVNTNGDICVKKYIDDGYSGELLERPGLDQLRNEAKKKLFTKIYVLSPDRLARKHHYAAIIMEDLARNGVELIFVNRPIGDSIEDKLLFNVQNIIAEYEKAKILDRLRRGKLFKIKQGYILGNTPPYGYRYVKDEKSRRGWYEINESETQTVRLIFQYYTSEECSGLGSLRKELCRLNIKNRSGSSKWSQSMVARIVSNETYIGTTYWGKFKSIEGESGRGYRRLLNTRRIRRPKEEWLPISVPAIIEEPLFRKAELKRLTNKSLSPNTVKNFYLLRGLMTHSCGAPIYSKLCHGQKYYICSSKRNSFIEKPKCFKSRYYSGDELERLIWNEFLKVVQSPTLLRQRINQHKSNSNSEKNALEAHIKDIDKFIANEEEKINRLVVAYSESAITLDELKNQKEEYEKKINSMVAEKEKLLSKISRSFEEFPEKINLESFSSKINSLLKDIDVSMKQSILRHFINKIVLDGGTAKITAVLPKEVLVAPKFTLSLLHEHRCNIGYPMEFQVRIPIKRITQKTSIKI